MLVVLGVSAVVAAGLYNNSRPAFRVSMSVTIEPSPGLAAARDVTAPEGLLPDTNPFGSPVVLAVLVSRNLSLAEVSSSLPPGSSLVAEWDGLQPTFVSLETTSDDAATAQAAMVAAESEARHLLSKLQSDRGVPPEIAYQVVSGGGLDFAVRVTPDYQRMVIVTLAAGLLTAVTLSSGLDVGVRRRQAVRVAHTDSLRAGESVNA